MRGPREAGRLAAMAVAAGVDVDTRRVRDDGPPRWYMWLSPDVEGLTDEQAAHVHAVDLWWVRHDGRWTFERGETHARTGTTPVAIDRVKRDLRWMGAHSADHR